MDLSIIVWWLTYLARFHRRQSNVSEELGRGRGGQVERCLVEVGILLSHRIAIHLLEDLIESELADTLGGVANGSRSPAKEKPGGTAFSNGDLESIAEGFVLLLVDLKPALDQVERGHGGVGDAAGQSSAHSAESKVLAGPKLAAVFVIRSSNHLSGGNLSHGIMVNIIDTQYHKCYFTMDEDSCALMGFGKRAPSFETSILPLERKTQCSFI